MKHCAARANRGHQDLTEHLAKLERTVPLEKVPAPRGHRESMPICTTECCPYRPNVHAKHRLDPRDLLDLPATTVSPADREEMEKTEPRGQLDRRGQWVRQDSRDRLVSEVLPESRGN